MSRDEQASPIGSSQSSWKAEEPCGEFAFDGYCYPLRLEVDATKELYRSHTPAREFMPLTITSGIRTGMSARFSIPLSDLPLPRGMRHHLVGEGQAWFYQEDRLLLLWRCNLLECYRVTNSLEDQNLHVLWKGFEQFLLRHFPQTIQIVTPSWNRPYDETIWLQFIKRQGFSRPSPTGIPDAAFIKDVKATT